MAIDSPSAHANIQRGLSAIVRVLDLRAWREFCLNLPNWKLSLLDQALRLTGTTLDKPGCLSLLAFRIL
jgi:hypothetical protein